MNKKILISILALIIILVFAFIIAIRANSNDKELNLWEFQSVDTMKYSRDLAREKLNDTYFDTTINKQVEDIAKTGATHVSIATPYDEEFYPILTRWVKAARRNNLNVWFRGNWSGWEGWFEYPKITREDHIEKTQNFILNHPDLFMDGDVFTSCPECENGGPGDPRHNGDIEGHRQFLIDEYGVTKSAFRQIGKNVKSNFNSMNGDVAKLVMNKETTKALGGIVTIDHYVASPNKLISDINLIASLSGGKVVLGEFGAPIKDINGEMSEDEQSEWIESAFYGFINAPEVVGINYWTNTGSSTELWKSNGEAKAAVATITSFYNVPLVNVFVRNELGLKIKNAKLVMGNKVFTQNEDGSFLIPFLPRFNSFEVSSPGYYSIKSQASQKDSITVVLKKERENSLFKLLKLLKNTY